MTSNLLSFSIGMVDTGAYALLLMIVTDVPSAISPKPVGWLLTSVGGTIHHPQHVKHGQQKQQFPGTNKIEIEINSNINTAIAKKKLYKGIETSVLAIVELLNPVPQTNRFQYLDSLILFLLPFVNIKPASTKIITNSCKKLLVICNGFSTKLGENKAIKCKAVDITQNANPAYISFPALSYSDAPLVISAL